MVMTCDDSFQGTLQKMKLERDNEGLLIIVQCCAHCWCFLLYLADEVII